MAKVHGVAGEWARVKGMVTGLWPLFLGVFVAGFALAATLLGNVAWGLSLFAVAIAYSCWSLSKGLRHVERFFKGARGEVAIAFVLARLPGGYSVFNGVDISDKGGPFRTHDFDHVVLTPTGLVVVETKNWRGRLTFDDGAIQIDGITPQRPPVAQVAEEASALSEWLEKNMPEPVQVIPLLCFAGDPLPADAPAEIGGDRLCGPDTLVNAIVATAGGDPLPPATR